MLVGVGIAEKARNGQRIDSVQQYQLPHGVLTAENRMGERLGKHHLILPRQRLPGIALQDLESHHVEEHRIGVQIAGCERIVAAHDVRAVRPEQAGGGFDLRHLFGQSGCYGRIELRPVTAPLRVSVMRPQLENTVAVAEAAVGGQVVIGVGEDQQSYGQSERQRQDAGDGAAAQFTQVAERETKVFHGRAFFNF